jgi:Mrp family chromosome partitioning ATPase
LIESWLRPIERLALFARERKCRAIGFVSPDAGAGTSRVCEEVAQALARSGSKTLLLDLSTLVQSLDKTPAWVPGIKGAAASVTADRRGFERLEAAATPDTRFLFNNVERLRWTMFDDLAAYQMIVVDLPSVLDAGADALNGVAMAAACDAAYLVCRMSQITRPRLERTVKQLKGGGVEIAGTVLNDATADMPGGKRLRKAVRGSPTRRLGAWIESKLLEQQLN